MNTYTVAFFGHRELSNQYAIEEKIKPILRELINSKEYVEFLVGRDGEFDQAAASAVREAAKLYGYGNTSLVLVLPYERAEYRDNMENFLAYYDEVEICPESANAHFKAAIGIRNRAMADRADLVICAIERKSGGAWAAVNYAEKQGKKIINLSE
ncbi:hypothetical protein [Ruminococcus sp.]|uniref:hypothetical protein n=1 Tax=Ruminococcus sp. TaxID=41978 RepID=UPI0025F50BF8|nr:hypothetical protein [Ruminococcus sp.]MBQ8964964.1 hypothetical protein [Ruminococcus sp.]